MPGIIIKPRARIFHGHEWVYGAEVLKMFGNPEPGDVITLKDFKDRSLGTGIFNPKSQIIARRFSRHREDLTHDFFVRRLRRALAWRETVPGLDVRLCRLVWSESDGLPGVIIDRYGDHFVLQTLTLAMDMRKELIVSALVEVFSPESVVERNDSPSRLAEGMETVTGVLHGQSPEPFRLTTQDGLTFLIDPVGGQKTGIYLDQLDNYQQAARRAKGRRVLDCFCNQGGFALAAALAGAEHVTAIDASDAAIETARANAEAMGVADRIEFVTGNVFDYLKAQEAAGAHWDVIILDPPSFARSRKTVGDALRGYKEIHLRALKLLTSGGILSTYCCSHHVSTGEFHEVILEAAVDAKRTLRRLEIHSQRADHPVLPGIPESEYLRGYTYELMPAF
ncbi:MAG: class I SAM-dependent rRNA methyltransferase [Verrucomicrobiaceae bacterium]|nr:MAG: class I SAM-dependent rRNA methyltransferase [Verrucomicrobiaceae bacterium]